MDKRKLLGNLSVAFLAQGVAMLISMATSLLVPKLLGVTEFGYWQLFLFYASYVGVFELGLNDGVYLLLGGESIGTINKSSVKSQFMVGLVFETIFAVAVGVATLALVSESQRAFVLLATCFYLVLQNTVAYFGYVFQALNETKWYSCSILVDRLTFMLALVGLLLLQVGQFEPYVVAFVLAKAICAAYCLLKGRVILRAKTMKPNPAVSETLGSMRVGIKLMVASLASMLILGVARFAVDAHWGIESFGEFSFALSLVNFVITFASQISMVLFPALRQSGVEELPKYYQASREVLGIVFPLVYVLYYPIVILLNLWLPSYAASFEYFALLLPLCLFDSQMDISCTTFFKVVRKERTLLGINVVTLVASALGCFISVYLFEDMKIMLLCISVAIMARGAFSDSRLLKEFQMPGAKLMASETVLSIAFLIAVMLAGPETACVVALFLYAAFLVVNKGEAKRVLSMGARALGKPMK